jgi:hypothetical protein
MSNTTAAPVQMSTAQAAAFEALVLHGTQPKAVNTAQSLIRRSLVEIDADGDLAVTADGWTYAREIGLVAAEAQTVTDDSNVVAVDFPAADEPNLPVEDETTTDDKAKAKATPKAKAAKSTEQTLRFPIQFEEFVYGIKSPTKATKAILARLDAQQEVDPKDKSKRIAVSDADLPVLLDHAKAMAQSATDGTAKRVANGRIRWIERMLAAKK